MSEETKKVKQTKKGVEIMDYATLIKTVSTKSKVPDARVKALLKEFVAAVGDGLKDGMAVKIPGFGVLHVRDVEPKTGEAAHAKRVVFSAAKKFNLAVKAG